MAFDTDIRRKIFSILQMGYYKDKEQLIEDLCKDFEDAGIFGANSLREKYEQELNQLILQSIKSSSGSSTVANFLFRLADAGLKLEDIDPILENIKFETQETKQNFVKQLSQLWTDVPKEIKYIKDEQMAEDFINFSIQYEKQIQNTYSKTQKVAEIFSKYGQPEYEQKIDKYYTFFFMDQKGQQIKDVITIANENFEQLLQETTTFRLNLALYKEEERKRILDEMSSSGNLEKLFQGLGYSADGNLDFQKTLKWYGGTSGAMTGQSQFLDLTTLQNRYNQLRIANERGLIRDLQGNQIIPNRLAEMVFYDDVFTSLQQGFGYRFNTNENIGAIAEGDYERNGVSVSIKTFAKSNRVQLMASSSEQSFAQIFKSKDTFKQYVNAKLVSTDQQNQKELSGIIDDQITKELSIVGKGQDYLKQDFEKIIQKNPVLQSLGISSDVILQLPEFQKIYSAARESQFSQGLGVADKEFLSQINNDKYSFYRTVIDNYVQSKYNPKTNKPTKTLQKWIKDTGYTSAAELSLIFDTPSEGEIHDQVVDELQQSIDAEPEIIFNLSL